MTRPPDRLIKSTEAGRPRTVLKTMAPGSNLGDTNRARSNAQAPARGRRSVGTIGPTDRVAVGYRDNSPGTTMTGTPFNITSWTFTEDEDGASVIADSGSIYLYAEGIYSTHMWLKVTGITAADPSCSIRLVCDVSDPFATSFDCAVRGGDGADGVGVPVFASTSRTYYDPGNGTSGGLSFKLNYSNLDVSVTQILAEIHVQRVG